MPWWEWNLSCTACNILLLRWWNAHFYCSWFLVSMFLSNWVIMPGALTRITIVCPWIAFTQAIFSTASGKIHEVLVTSKLKWCPLPNVTALASRANDIFIQVIIDKNRTAYCCMSYLIDTITTMATACQVVNEAESAFPFKCHTAWKLIPLLANYLFFYPTINC